MCLAIKKLRYINPGTKLKGWHVFRLYADVVITTCPHGLKVLWYYNSKSQNWYRRNAEPNHRDGWVGVPENELPEEVKDHACAGRLAWEDRQDAKRRRKEEAVPMKKLKEAEEKLATWQRKLKLAETKVKRYTRLLNLRRRKHAPGPGAKGQ